MISYIFTYVTLYAYIFVYHILIRKIEEGERRWVERLKEFVAIKSVSGDTKVRGDVKNMVEHVKKVYIYLVHLKIFFYLMSV